MDNSEWYLMLMGKSKFSRLKDWMACIQQSKGPLDEAVPQP